MSRQASIANWENGVNNLAPANRLPEGFVRDLLNLDPVSGNLVMRIGYEQVAAGTSCRAVMTLGDRVLYVDGTSLFEYDSSTNSTKLLRTIAGAGPVANCVHNNELFISTANETLRYDGVTIREWGVVDVRRQPDVVVSNAAENGRRLYAMTYTNEYGEEGGTTIAATVPDADYTFTIPPLTSGIEANLYISALNGQTLYYQGTYASESTVEITNPVDDTRTLATMHSLKPQPCKYMTSWRGTILMGHDSVVEMTHPMSPHLVMPATSFFQYPADVGMLLAGMRGVYVSADKVYRIVDPETDSPSQQEVSDYPAVPGTGTILPNGNAAWLTRYGMSLESGDPREGVIQPNGTSFVPKEAELGVSGVVENNGNEMVVTALKNSSGPNTLAAQDYFEAEVIRP